MWAIEKEGEKVCLTILGKRAIDPKTKSEYKEITSVEPGRTADELKINLKDSAQGRRLLRSKFDGTNYQDLAEATSNRLFIEEFRKYLGEHVSDVRSSAKKRKEREQLVTEEDQVKRKRTAEDQDVTNKYIGAYKLALTQLIPAPPCSQLRQLNQGWVTSLTKRLLLTVLQNTIIPVMRAPQFSESTEGEAEEEEFWLLGGNHFVAALRQVDPDRKVLCHVYADLTKFECLRIAANHNKKGLAFPLTFQDRVAIARRIPDEDGKLSSRLREVLGEIELKEIKDSISTIVSVARYTETNYNLFEQLSEQASNQQKSVNQKLFKLLQGEAESTITDTLHEAVEKGLPKACQWLEMGKKRAALQRVFTRETKSSSWEEACIKYPKKSKMLFQLHDTKGKYISQDLLDFCHTEDYQDDIQIEIKLTLNNEEVQQTEQIKALINRYKSKHKRKIHIPGPSGFLPYRGLPG